MENKENKNQIKKKKKKEKDTFFNPVAGISVVIILILLAVVYVVFFPSTDSDDVEASNNSTVAEVQESQDDSNNPASESPGAYNEKGEINTVGTETDLDGLKQTLTAATANTTLGNSTAPEGQTFFKTDWTINNTTATELGVNPNNYVAYANGKQVPAVKVEDPSVSPLIASTVPAGGSISGSLVFQVPSDWSEIQIYSHINPTVNKEVEYRITSDQM